MRPPVAAVLAALKAAADDRGRITIDQNALSRVTGFSPAICGLARQELYRMKLIRRVGWSIPTTLQILEDKSNG